MNLLPSTLAIGDRPLGGPWATLSRHQRRILWGHAEPILAIAALKGIHVA